MIEDSSLSSSIDSSTFLSCNASYGGALYLYQGLLYISHTSFSASNATKGAAVYWRVFSEDQDTPFSYSYFNMNYAQEEGSDVYFEDTNNNIPEVIFSNSLHISGSGNIVNGWSEKEEVIKEGKEKLWIEKVGSEECVTNTPTIHSPTLIHPIIQHIKSGDKTLFLPINGISSTQREDGNTLALKTHIPSHFYSTSQIDYKLSEKADVSSVPSLSAILYIVEVLSTLLLLLLLSLSPPPPSQTAM